MKTFLTIFLSLMIGIAIGSGFTEAKFEQNMKKLACASTYDNNSDVVDCVDVITTENIVVFERMGLAKKLGHY